MIWSWLRQGTLTVLTVGVAAGAATACGTPSPQGNPDPGNRILAELKTVERAVPADTRVTLRQEYESHWDSCDGDAGTFGWTNVIVNVEFTSGQQVNALADEIGATLHAQGWRHTDTTSMDLGPATRWTRTVAGSKPASTTFAPLTRNDDGSITWDLTAVAPPKGKTVSGC